MANDESRYRHLLGRPLRGDALEAVAADSELAPARGQRVGGCLLRQGGVESGIEDGDVRSVGERLACRLDRSQRGRIVQRRKLVDRVEFGEYGLVDQHRRAEAVAAVDDAVADGLDIGRHFLDRRHRLCVAVFVDERELEAGRAGVDDEDVQCGQVQSRISGSSSPCSRV